MDNEITDSIQVSTGSNAADTTPSLENTTKKLKEILSALSRLPDCTTKVRKGKHICHISKAILTEILSTSEAYIEEIYYKLNATDTLLSIQGWSEQEDEMLLDLVDTYSTLEWPLIAEEFEHHDAEECATRYQELVDYAEWNGFVHETDDNTLPDGEDISMDEINAFMTDEEDNAMGSLSISASSGEDMPMDDINTSTSFGENGPIGDVNLYAFSEATEATTANMEDVPTDDDEYYNTSNYHDPLVDYLENLAARHINPVTGEQLWSLNLLIRNRSVSTTIRTFTTAFNNLHRAASELLEISSSLIEDLDYSRLSHPNCLDPLWTFLIRFIDKLTLLGISIKRSLYVKNAAEVPFQRCYMWKILLSVVVAENQQEDTQCPICYSDFHSRDGPVGMGALIRGGVMRNSTPVERDIPIALRCSHIICLACCIKDFQRQVEMDTQHGQCPCCRGTLWWGESYTPYVRRNLISLGGVCKWGRKDSYFADTEIVLKEEDEQTAE